MKTRLPILFLLPALIFLIGTGALAAGNPKPADCISLNNPYYRAPDNVSFYSFVNSRETMYGYIPYFRAFIPPGTIVMDLLILEAGNQMAVAHHQSPPSGLPSFTPGNYTPDNYFSLNELLAHDQWVTETQQGYLYISHDSFYPFLDIPRAGWLYVKVGGGSPSQIYDNTFSVRVDTKAYNEWWDQYIKDEAGWYQFIESVETYEDPMNPSTQPVLSVLPLNQAVSSLAGTTSFAVSNTGTGTMPWAAQVVSDSTWLTIASGDSGSNAGTIECNFEANTGTSSRTATIRVSASGATGTPVDVTVTQAPAQSCTATINGELLLHVPYITYTDTNSPLQIFSFWADFVYEFNPAAILFKLTGVGIVENPSFSCAASTLSSDFSKINIPDLLIFDGLTHYWVELEYSPTRSSGVNFYFQATKAGTVSN